jgi:hypothetical protein
MYCVVRFSNRDKNTFTEIGAALNQCRPGLYEGLDFRKLDRFSCTVASGDDWESQRQGIIRLINDCGEIIHSAQIAGTDVCFDLAVYEEDYNDKNATGVFFDTELLKLLSDANIGIGIAIYGQSSNES